MLYISSYINKCISNTLGIFLNCFQNINNIFVNNDNMNDNYKKHDFYNFKHLSKLEEVIIYDKPERITICMSSPNIIIKDKDNEWNIY